MTVGHQDSSIALGVGGKFQLYHGPKTVKTTAKLHHKQDITKNNTTVWIFHGTLYQCADGVHLGNRHLESF